MGCSRRRTSAERVALALSFGAPPTRCGSAATWRRGSRERRGSGPRPRAPHTCPPLAALAGGRGQACGRAALEPLGLFVSTLTCCPYRTALYTCLICAQTPV